MNDQTHSLTILLISLATTSLVAQQPVQDIRWSDVEQSAIRDFSQIVSSESPDVGELLRIEHVDASPVTFPLLTLPSPGITEINYAVTGRVRHTNVATGSFLEMWSHFPDGKSYFSRTLNDTGPMKNLEGSSEWRAFALPFSSSPDAGTPIKLELNLVLGGPGTVELGPLSVVQYDDATQLATIGQPPGWWTSRFGALLGAVGGTVFGLLGGLVGLLVSCGIGKRFVQGLTATMFASGCLGLLAGLAAVINHQPYHVYYPMLLLGVVLTAVTGPMWYTVRQRYQQQELRRMAAMDLANPTL